ncbi:DUF6197 family protein [Streptomyces scabiei]|uniref:DUF6197 family protein n=1 Tax=Streptomyces scabiei TaxID=1930 RepID=UPI001B341E7E|nr:MULTISPECIES: DUF6197 family protein [Streptomyces]MBP5896349.1 hypothetical protein [Streptomyces sp. LBUM 1481]MDX3298633.1 DUF6197 family protein [Streptomyces scabiei]
MRYSADSTVLPTTAADLLNWAAAHIEARGFHDGRNGERFGHDGHTTTTCLLRPGMLGALDVAGGDGRRSSARTYDYPALYAAQRLALDTVADLAAGGAVPHDVEWSDEHQYRRFVVHRWGMQDGRTGAEAVALFQEAAEVAERASVAAMRPGRPPTRLHLPTVGDVLEWAAAHIEDAGHRPGELTHDPAGYADTAACTMLHALDRALVAAKPNPGGEHAAWEAFRAAAPGALRLLVEHLTGGPVDVGADEREASRQLRGTVLMWGNMPGRSTAEVAEAFRAAVPASADGVGVEEQVEPGQAAFF